MLLKINNLIEGNIVKRPSKFIKTPYVADVIPLNQNEEIALIKELTKLPELVEEIVGDYQVQKLPTYGYNLATKFHQFYEKCPVIIKDNDELMSARVELLKATQIVLKNTLNLMGISAPCKM